MEIDNLQFDLKQQKKHFKEQIYKFNKLTDKEIEVYKNIDNHSKLKIKKLNQELKMTKVSAAIVLSTILI